MCFYSTTPGLFCGGSQSYKVERIDVRKATVCWPARKTGYRSLAPSAPRQQRASQDGDGAADGGQAGSGSPQPDGSANSHALGPSQGVVVLGLQVRFGLKPDCLRSQSGACVLLRLLSECSIIHRRRCADQRAGNHNQQWGQSAAARRWSPVVRMEGGAIGPGLLLCTSIVSQTRLLCVGSRLRSVGERVKFPPLHMLRCSYAQPLFLASYATCLQLRRLSDALQALKRGAVSVAVFAATQLAPLVTRVLTSVPVDVSNVQVSYKVRQTPCKLCLVVEWSMPCRSDVPAIPLSLGSFSLYSRSTVPRVMRKPACRCCFKVQCRRQYGL